MCTPHTYILKEAAVKVRVVVGDDDSATIAAVRQGNPEHIFELSDSNHLNKHFVFNLHALKSSFSEMQSKGVITHLKKCFTYAIQQNRGKTVELASILRSIPYHAFGQHDNCKHWCHKKESLNSSQKPMILLKDPNLQIKLHEIFEKYASNASKFSIAASSQANESLHNIMAHKSPKNNCYSLSESSDYRLASSVASKNNGDKYLLDVKKKLSIVPGKHTTTYAAKQEMKRTRRAEKTKLPASKRRRHELISKREALRQKNEGSEGIQYQSSYGMQKAMENLMSNPQTIIEKLPFITLSTETCIFGYFDLETSGFKRTADILQIACKIEDNEFNIYIDPTQLVDYNAFEATGVQNINGFLYHNGQQVNSIPIHEALIKFYTFLKSFSKPPVLLAHNCKFDSAHLIRAIIEHSIVQDFSKISGFVDSCYLLKKLLPERNGKGAFKLEELAKDLLKVTSFEKFHEAMYDVKILEQLTNSFIPKSNIIIACKLYKESVMTHLMSPYLVELKTVLSPSIYHKLASAGITYNVLKNYYLNDGRNKVVELLSEKNLNNNKPLVTKNENVIDKIINSLARE